MKGSTSLETMASWALFLIGFFYSVGHDAAAAAAPPTARGERAQALTAIRAAKVAEGRVGTYSRARAEHAHAPHRHARIQRRHAHAAKFSDPCSRTTLAAPQVAPGPHTALTNAAPHAAAPLRDPSASATPRTRPAAEHRLASTTGSGGADDAAAATSLITAPPLCPPHSERDPRLPARSQSPTPRIPHVRTAPQGRTGPRDHPEAIPGPSSAELTPCSRMQSATSEILRDLCHQARHGTNHRLFPR